MKYLICTLFLVLSFKAFSMSQVIPGTLDYDYIIAGKNVPLGALDHSPEYVWAASEEDQKVFYKKKGEQAKIYLYLLLRLFTVQ